MASFLVGHVEILIHFHEFANVDLFHQGLYQIRCHAYTRVEDLSQGSAEIVSATPLKLWQKDAEGSINEKEKSYNTKVFSIQYCDEEVELNEGIIFGAEIDVVDTRDQFTYLDFMLMFAEQESPKDFALAAYQSIRLQNPHFGLASHFKLTFDSFHFSTTALTIISTMTDIKKGVHRKDQNRAAPVLPARALVPKNPPSLKYISKCATKNGSKNLNAQTVESKLNAVYDPERNVAATLQTDSPSYVHHSEGLTVETDAYRPPKSGAWSEPTIHDFLCYFEACRRTSRQSTPSTSSSTAGRVTDIGEIMKERVDRVGKRFHELLLRNYYFLSTLTISLIARAMSKSDLRQMTWMSASPPLKIPGGFTIFAGIDGLPDLTSIKTGRDSSSSLKKTIRVYLDQLFVHRTRVNIEDSAEDFVPKSQTVQIDTISFIVPYLPVSYRSKIRDNKKTLISDLQSILTDDINLFWCQISEKWHRLCMTVSMANKETNFFFEMVHTEVEHRRLTQLFRREIILKGNCHTQIDPAQYHVSLAEQHRKSNSSDSLADEGRLLNTAVEDCHESPNMRNVPLIFEEIYEDVNPQDTLALNKVTFDSLNRGREDAGAASFAPLNDLQEWMEDAIPVEREEHGVGGDLNSAFFSSHQTLAVNHENPITFHKWVTHLDPKPYEGLHLIVLVHGFRGNAFDLRVFKNYLQRLYPEHIYLLSSVNEGKSDDDVQVQGARLCDEIMKYVDDLCTWDNIGRISFVCHSLGGLITRAAVPLLISRQAETERKLYLYMSLSTPHLGYTAARNRFVDAGLWVLKKWKRSQSLAQLCMCDAKDFKDTFLNAISVNGALDKFKKLYFVSSPQDNYVPYESARIEFSQRVVNDPLWAKVYEHLVTNIFRGIKNFVRLDVAFKIENKNIDSIIGRTAHINFLSSESLAQMITTHYAASFM